MQCTSYVSTSLEKSNFSCLKKLQEIYKKFSMKNLLIAILGNVICYWQNLINLINVPYSIICI